MSPQSPARDYKPGMSGHETAVGSLPHVEDFLLRLARAVRYFHTYPTTSPLCADAIASCHSALAALDHSDRLAFRVTPHELVVDDVGIGAGTIIEQELVRRLHRSGVAALDIVRTASPRDLTHLCESVIRCNGKRDETAFADLLVELGVDTIVGRMARRPEVLNLGLPPAPLRDLVDHDQRRRRAAPAAGPVDYLYPPEKGWIRLDPAANLATVSLLDLAILVNDPADMATMLLRLTDDDPAGAVAADQALEQKFADVAMLFAALDGHVARVMFAKLARAVLAIDADRRDALLRRTILPGLLDGRPDGHVLRDFPDPDLAESLCLLLDLETAAPEVVGAALHKLDLPAGRRQSVAALVDEHLNRGTAMKPATPARDPGDRYIRRLVQVDANPGANFAEFAAFDLSIDDHTADAIAAARQSIATTDLTLAQLDCLRRLVRLEPNPGLAKSFMARALDLFGELDDAARWHDLADAATSFRRLTYELKETRPDVAETVECALEQHWTGSRVLTLLALQQRDPEGRATVRLLVDAFGSSIASGFVAVLGDATLQAAAPSLVSLMCDNALVLAPSLVRSLRREHPAAARAIVRVLGFAGIGYEIAISEQLASGDEQLVRASLRALARIGTSRAAALVAFQIHAGGPAARAAEEALWHFPAALTTLQLRDLLSRRQFVLQNPDVAARLMDRAAQSDTGDLGGVLDDLEALRFRVWNPDLVRLALKARGLRGR
jgi:hypothetical protein